MKSKKYSLSKKLFAMLISLSAILSVMIIPAVEVNAYSYYLGDWYYLESALDSNMVIGITGGRGNGENVALYKKRQGDSSQLFKIVRNGSGYYSIINKYSGKALDIKDCSTATGANVHQWQMYNNHPSQQWKLYTASGYPDTGYINIKSKCGKYLDVSGASTANGTNIQIWDRNGTKAQVFKMVPLVETFTKTYKLNFTTFEQWKKLIQFAPQKALGISQYKYNTQFTLSTGTMIVGATVLETKPVKVQYSQYGVKKTVTIYLPSKIRYKLHKHTVNQSVWFDFTNLTMTQSCSCGDRVEYKWEIPYPVEDKVTNVEYCPTAGTRLESGGYHITRFHY